MSNTQPSFTDVVSDDISAAYRKGFADGLAIPLSSIPELQEKIRQGLNDGSIVLNTGETTVKWTPSDEARLDEALRKQFAKRRHM